jgi:hypothetical protein
MYEERTGLRDAVLLSVAALRSLLATVKQMHSNISRILSKKLVGNFSPIKNFLRSVLTMILFSYKYKGGGGFP